MPAKYQRAGIILDNSLGFNVLACLANLWYKGVACLAGLQYQVDKADFQ